MKYVTIGLTFLCLSFLFYSLMEILETTYIDECPILLSISKTIVLLFLAAMIVFSIRRHNTDCLFIGIIIYLIYSCILFFFHLLLEINKHKLTTEFYLIVVFNIFSAFTAFFACIFLFLLHREIKKSLKGKIKHNMF